MNMTSRHIWVCAICGDGFTRRSSAKRHNQNLHLGNGIIVRPFEYIIGRLNGKFQEPKDTLLFRRNNKGKIRKDYQNPLIFTHEGYNNTNSYNNNYNNDKNFNRNAYGTPESCSEIPVGNAVKSQRSSCYQGVNYNQSNSSFDRLRKMSKAEKFIEFQKFINKYCSPLDAQKMLKVAYVLTFNIGDESFLDDQLKLLAPWIK